MVEDNSKPRAYREQLPVETDIDRRTMCYWIKIVSLGLA